jgi:arylsulfatase A-like enzyme
MVLSDHGMAAAPQNPIWPGWHAPEALFIMAGGPVRPGVTAERVSYLDIAPTVLYLLGYPVPGDLPGRVLEEFIEEDFRARFPLVTAP